VHQRSPTFGIDKNFAKDARALAAAPAKQFDLAFKEGVFERLRAFCARTLPIEFC